jgi:hypothetical protein
MERLCALGGTVAVEHIGRIGRGERVWTEMQARYGTRLRFTRHGEQAVERVSRFLREIDFGIVTTPVALLGKSASFTTMAEHGLPVIVPRDDVRYAGIDAGAAPEGVIVVDDRFDEAVRGAARGEARWRLAETAEQFLKSIGAVAS